MPVTKGKARGRLRGGRGGKERGRSPRSARVVDPGLFYALRANVRATLMVLGGEPLDEGLISRLKQWLEDADAWSSQVSVREQEPGRRELQRGLAPGEGDSPPGGKVTRHVRALRKPGQAPTPSVPEELRSVAVLKKDSNHGE